MIASASAQLRLTDFDYTLPEDLIAQEPSISRDSSRLLVIDRMSGALTHRVFSDIEAHLRPGDLLVLNDTKVVPCRIPARRPGGGNAEIFLLEEQGPNSWQALVKGRVSAGKRLNITDSIDAEITQIRDDGTRVVRFHCDGDIRTHLNRIGNVPLPPYIRRSPSTEDLERYQTVYASRDGAVAAPTAGLHFTRMLLGRLARKGIESAFVTLHVGPGTFQPVRADVISKHVMLPEQYVVTEAAAESINRALAEQRRVIAVGTTSVRTLEAAGRGGCMAPGAGKTDLFIYPGYQFRVVSGLITNFHLPKSTLLMLVSAFGGRERVLTAYGEAVARQYRFYSYGDAMFIS